MKELRLPFVIAAFCLISVSGCNDNSPELKAILGSSAANMPLLTAEEVRRWHKDKQEALGKSYNAELNIEYKPKDTYSTRDVFAEIVSVLRRNDWTDDTRTMKNPAYYVAFIPYGSFELLAEVFLLPDAGLIKVNITHRMRL